VQGINTKFVTLLLWTNALALAATPQSGVEKSVAERTGKRVQWDREASIRDEVRQTVKKLLRRPLTADTAAQIALLNNQTLQATLEDIGISQADLREAGLLKNPTLDGFIRFPNRTPSAANIEGGLTQDFLDLLILPLRKRVAAAKLEQTRLRVADDVLKLVADTKIAFYELQAQQQLFERLKLVLETNDAALDLTQRQHDAGNVPDLALANQQIGYSESRLEAATAEAEIREKREKLNRLMGLWGGDTDWSATDELPEVPSVDLPARGLETLAVEQRLDLAAAKAELASLVQALGLTRTYRFIGALEFGVSSERDTDRQTMTGPTVNLALPIFNQGQARVAKAQAQLRQAERRLEALAVEIRSEVREKRDRLVAKRDAAQFYKNDVVPGRTRVVELTQLEYNAMLVGVFDLLMAKRNELNAQRGYIDAVRDYWITRAELERAVGGSLSPRGTTRIAPADTKLSAKTKVAPVSSHQHH
jgi:cobalt-zinc-cadmium efflux system outer membrane protein